MSWHTGANAQAKATSTNIHAYLTPVFQNKLTLTALMMNSSAGGSSHLFPPPPPPVCRRSPGWFARRGCRGIYGWKERKSLASLSKECLACRGRLPVCLSAGVHFSIAVCSFTLLSGHSGQGSVPRLPLVHIYNFQPWLRALDMNPDITRDHTAPTRWLWIKTALYAVFFQCSVVSPSQDPYDHSLAILLNLCHMIIAVLKGKGLYLSTRNGIKVIDVCNWSYTTDGRWRFHWNAGIYFTIHSLKAYL